MPAPPCLHRLRPSAPAPPSPERAAIVQGDRSVLLEGLRRISRFELPSIVVHEIEDRLARHGDHSSDPDKLRLQVRERTVRDRLAADRKAGAILAPARMAF